MNPQIVVIIEDQPGRIGNLLLALRDFSDCDLLDDIKQSASKLARAYATESEDGNPIAWGFPSIIDNDHIKVICPHDDKITTLEDVYSVLAKCSRESGLCFLDLELNHREWDVQAGRMPLRFSAALSIADRFERRYGRMLVQSSSAAGGVGYRAPKDENYYNGEHYYAEELGGAIALVHGAVVQYRRRYLSHNEPRVAGCVGFLWSGWVSEWDSARPSNLLHPFHHNWLQEDVGRPTEHLKNIARFLGSNSAGISVTATHLGAANGASAKGMFELARRPDGRWIVSTMDCRDISNNVLKAMLCVLDIQAEVNLEPPATEWRLPLKPGAAFLFALRAFLGTCTGTGREKPRVGITGRKSTQAGSNWFEGELLLNFQNQSDGTPCQLVTRYRTNTDGNQHPPVRGADTCCAFYNLLRARIELPEELMETGLATFSIGRDALEYQPKELDSNQVLLTWRIPLI